MPSKPPNFTSLCQSVMDKKAQGWKDEYSSMSEFKQNLMEASLVEEKRGRGWLLRRETNAATSKQEEKITDVLKQTSLEVQGSYFLVQFWAAVKVRGQLSASNQPFLVSSPAKGITRYRNKCMDSPYVVDIVKNVLSSTGEKANHTSEFARRCGFNQHRVLTLCDASHEFYGVLEILCENEETYNGLLSAFEKVTNTYVDVSYT